MVKKTILWIFQCNCAHLTEYIIQPFMTELSSCPLRILFTNCNGWQNDTLISEHKCSLIKETYQPAFSKFDWEQFKIAMCNTAEHWKYKLNLRQNEYIKRKPEANSTIFRVNWKYSCQNAVLEIHTKIKLNHSIVHVANDGSTQLIPSALFDILDQWTQGLYHKAPLSLIEFDKHAGWQKLHKSSIISVHSGGSRYFPVLDEFCKKKKKFCDGKHTQRKQWNAVYFWQTWQNIHRKVVTPAMTHWKGAPARYDRFLDWPWGRCQNSTMWHDASHMRHKCDNFAHLRDIFKTAVTHGSSTIQCYYTLPSNLSKPRETNIWMLVS